MKTKTICMKIKEIVEREEDNQTIVFDYDDKEKRWVYHAPNAQNHTQEQLEIILSKLMDLNNVEVFVKG